MWTFRTINWSPAPAIYKAACEGPEILLCQCEPFLDTEIRIVEVIKTPSLAARLRALTREVNNPRGAEQLRDRHAQCDMTVSRWTLDGRVALLGWTEKNESEGKTPKQWPSNHTARIKTF
jgi:hypothetical protein